jgi:hypothetical protein
MVLVFVLGLAVGLTIGFPVGLLKRSVDASWFEAVGTWVGAGITAIAVIVAGIVFFSEEYMRRREHRRQIEADQRADHAEEERLQREADLILCDVHYDRATVPTEAGMVTLQSLRVVVDNQSSTVISQLACRVTLHSMNWTIPLRLTLGPGEHTNQPYEPSEPFEVRWDNTDLHENVEFTFLLGGAQWTTRVRQRARRLVTRARGLIQ